MKKADLKQEWAKFIKTRTKEQIAQLEASGFDTGDPQSENLHRFHRTFQEGLTNKQGNKPSDSGTQAYSEKLSFMVHKMAGNTEKESDPAMDFAVAIAARVIDIFDCSRDRQVRLHADCMRLAIGYPSARSQSEICDKYNLSKANVSWRVRSIQRKFDLPRCFTNGNRVNK
jgi:hypothetical protein